MNRRDFLLTVPAGLLLPWETYQAYAQGSLLARLLAVGPVIVRRVSSVVLGGIGGFLVTEFIGGVLRAYDLDISRYVEDAIRRYIRHEDGFSVTYATSSGYISGTGYCATGGSCRVHADGFVLQGPGLEPHFTIGPLLWAAVGSASMASSVDKLRCGYPTGPCVNRSPEKRNYEFVEQRFQRGVARLIVDDIHERTIEGVFRRNRDAQVWFEA